jgi:hypothetical protein
MTGAPNFLTASSAASKQNDVSRVMDSLHERTNRENQSIKAVKAT